MVVIGLLTHGWIMTHMVARGPGRLWHYSMHGLVAIYFALLLALRMVWRLGERTPLQPQGSAAWEVGASRLAHLALYLLMIAILVTGYMMWSSLPGRVDPARAALWDFQLFGLLKVPAVHAIPTREITKFWEDWHESLSHILEAVVVLHVAAALWHHFVKRDTVLRRMWGGGV